MEVKDNKSRSQKIVSTIFFIVIIAYLVLILSRSLWQNYQVNKEVKNLEEKVVQLKERNQRLKNLVIYYQTDSYKEKEARRKLLMKKPGERVLALPDVEYSHEEQEPTEEEQTDTSQTQEANYQQWIEYIFG